MVAFNWKMLICLVESFLQKQKNHEQRSITVVLNNAVAVGSCALENFPLLMYILAAKTLILCLAFAAAKMYQRKRIEEKLKREHEVRLKKETEKKED